MARVPSFPLPLEEEFRDVPWSLISTGPKTLLTCHNLYVPAGKSHVLSLYFSSRASPRPRLPTPTAHKKLARISNVKVSNRAKEKKKTKLSGEGSLDPAVQSEQQVKDGVKDPEVQRPWSPT